MNFQTLQNNVADWLNRDDLGSVIPSFIQIAQRRLERRHNFNAMKATVTTNSSEMKISIPARFKMARAFYVQDGGKDYLLIKDTPYHALALYSFRSEDKGRPKIYAVAQDTNEFIIRPTPDKSYPFELHFYRYTADLSNPTDTTNWWTDNAWEILLYGALVQAEPYLKNDERLALWKLEYNEMVSELLNLERREEFAGSPQTLTSSYVPDS